MSDHYGGNLNLEGYSDDNSHLKCIVCGDDVDNSTHKEQPFLDERNLCDAHLAEWEDYVRDYALDYTFQTMESIAEAWLKDKSLTEEVSEQADSTPPWMRTWLDNYRKEMKNDDPYAALEAYIGEMENDLLEDIDGLKDNLAATQWTFMVTTVLLIIFMVVL